MGNGSLKEQYSSIADWILEVRRTGSNSDATEETYLSSFKLFLEATNINPDEIVEQWENSKLYVDKKGVIHNEKEDLSRNLEKIIKNYLYGLNPQRLTCSYRRKISDVLRSFFGHHKITVDIPVLSISDGCPEYEQKPLTREDIERIIDNSVIREKAYDKFLESSGLRPVTVCKLRKTDINTKPRDCNLKVTYDEWLENPDEVPCVLVICPKKKTKGKRVDHHTWIDRETLEFLKTYFEARERGTRKIPPETITDKSYLFVQMRSPPKPASKQSMSNLFSDVASQLGIKEEAFDVTIYMLKDYFEKQCGKGVDDLRYIDFWEGHVSYGRKQYFRSYFNPTIEESREQYVKCIPYLRIKKVAVTVDHRIVELQKKLAKAEQEKAELLEQFQKLQREQGNLLTFIKQAKDFDDLKSRIVLSKILPEEPKEKPKPKPKREE